MSSISPGLVVLFGSGETSPSGRRVFDHLFRILPDNPRVSVLETPAGYELNSDQVAGQLVNFLGHYLQNYHPQVELIPARKRDTTFSPDNEHITTPLLTSDLIFARPGSPSYAVRQLRNSIAWCFVLARHRLGAALVFSSATVIALGTMALPVYEIYKVGEDLHWKSGLDFFSPYWDTNGIPLIFIHHWNNNDGGDDLDTRHCFMGQARFEAMVNMLPENKVTIGIDEHTALWIDCSDGCFEISGLGSVTILRDGKYEIFNNGDIFLINEMIDRGITDPDGFIPSDIWEAAKIVAQTANEDALLHPQFVLDLMEEHQSARNREDWSVADKLRDQILASGWRVMDTPDGPVLDKD